MKKIYEHIEYARVGHFQTILEEAGIPTLVKNLDAAIGAGEVPFTELFPELWVLEETDYDRALAMLESYHSPEPSLLGDWVCGKCGEAVEKEFGECWNCGTLRPEYAAAFGEKGPEIAE